MSHTLKAHAAKSCSTLSDGLCAKTIVLVAAVGFLSACSSQPQVPFSYTLEPLSFEPGNTYNVSDGRARFREIFCAANADHGESLPDYRPCEDALVRFEDEPEPTGEPVDLGVSSAGLLGKMVPGLAYSCIKAWLHHDNSAPNHVATLGYETGFIQVEGIASSETNATLIADYIAGLGPEHSERPLILFGYSKGVPDIFAFLKAYPELTDRVAAVVSYAGAVWGSPLADTADEKQLKWLTHIPAPSAKERTPRLSRPSAPLIVQLGLLKTPCRNTSATTRSSRFQTPRISPTACSGFIASWGN